MAQLHPCDFDILPRTFTSRDRVEGISTSALIDTPEGLRSVGDLRPGDLVLSADGVSWPVLWTRRRKTDAVVRVPGAGDAALGQDQVLVWECPLVRAAFGDFATSEIRNFGPSRMGFGLAEVVDILLPVVAALRIGAVIARTMCLNEDAFAALPRPQQAEVMRAVPALRYPTCRARYVPTGTYLDRADLRRLYGDRPLPFWQQTTRAEPQHDKQDDTHRQKPHMGRAVEEVVFQR